MSFGYTCHFFGYAELAQELSTEYAVAYVGFGAVAVDARCIGKEYAYVVQHCCSAYALVRDINISTPRKADSEVGYLRGVF